MCGNAKCIMVSTVRITGYDILPTATSVFLHPRILSIPHTKWLESFNATDEHYIPYSGNFTCSAIFNDGDKYQQSMSVGWAASGQHFDLAFLQVLSLSTAQSVEQFT